MSGSDVYKRQILTSKDGQRTVKVNTRVLVALTYGLITLRCAFLHYNFRYLLNQIPTFIAKNGSNIYI